MNLRINLYFSENNDKDVTITNYLNSKYSAKDYIKEILYAAAIGQSIIQLVNKEVAIEAPEDEYEKIEGLDGIDL